MADTPARELVLRLHTLSKSLRLIRHRGAELHPAMPAGLLGVLLHIDEPASGCSGRDLAARTGLDPSTISRAVAGLVAHGWIERAADPTDGRARVLRLTPAGRAALAEALDRYGAVLSEALADWSQTDIAALCGVMDRLSRDIDRSLGHALTEHSHPTHTDSLEAAR